MSEPEAPAPRRTGRTVVTVVVVVAIIAAVLGGAAAYNAFLKASSMDAAYDALLNSEATDDAETTLPLGFPILNSQRADCDDTEYDENGEVCLVSVLVDGAESADDIQTELEAVGYRIEARDTFDSGEFGTGATRSQYTDDTHTVIVFVHYPEGEPHWVADYKISSRG